MGRSQALANERCAASCEAAKLRRDRTGLTGRLRCISVIHGCNSKDSYGRTAVIVLVAENLSARLLPMVVSVAM